MTSFLPVQEKVPVITGWPLGEVPLYKLLYQRHVGTIYFRIHDILTQLAHALLGQEPTISLSSQSTSLIRFYAIYIDFSVFT